MGSTTFDARENVTKNNPTAKNIPLQTAAGEQGGQGSRGVPTAPLLLCSSAARLYDHIHAIRIIPQIPMETNTSRSKIEADTGI